MRWLQWDDGWMDEHCYGVCIGRFLFSCLFSSLLCYVTRYCLYPSSLVLVLSSLPSVLGLGYQNINKYTDYTSHLQYTVQSFRTRNGYGVSYSSIKKSLSNAEPVNHPSIRNTEPDISLRVVYNIGSCFVGSSALGREVRPRRSSCLADAVPYLAETTGRRNMRS